MVATDVTRSDTPDPEVRETDVVRGKDSPPVVWLARLSVLFLVLEIYVFARWIFSDAFTSTPSGPDHDPNMFWIRTWEVASIVGSILFVAWLIRKTIREKQLSPLGIVAGAWILTAWQDPGVDALRPIYSYDSNFFNRGTWAQFIPGWSVHAGANPQPIWFWIGIYLCFVPLGMAGAAAFLNLVRRTFPRINRAGIVVASILLFLVLDIVGEQVTLRQGLDQYFRVNHNLALWPGHYYQFPMYEAAGFGVTMLILGALIYYFRDQRGHMITDRGIDRVKITKGRTAIRILALGAVFNVVMVVFNLGFNYANQHADTTPPSVPSYFSNGFCGIDPNPPCPGPR